MFAVALCRARGRAGGAARLFPRRAPVVAASVGSRTRVPCCAVVVNQGTGVSGVRAVHVRAGVAAASDGNDDAAGSDGSDATAASRYAIPHDPADHPGLPEMFEGERWEILATETEAESSEGDSEEHIGEVNIDLMATSEEERYLNELMLDEFATSDEDSLPSPPIGDPVTNVPLEALEHFSNPVDMNSPGVYNVLNDIYQDVPKVFREGDKPEPVREGMGSDDEVAFERPTKNEEEQRIRVYKELRAQIEDPIPIVTRPLWPLYSSVLQVDTVTVMTKRGQEQHTRVLVIVGNKKGAAGFGIGKHESPGMATRYALRRAQRDMIHVNTRDGQLYHDLIGKKNNTQVIIRSVPPRLESRGSALIQTVMEFMGIEYFSAKIVGSKTKNRYTIIQALFDAFQNYTPPEEFAYKRGKRFVFVGKDRRFPRDVFPFYPSGPRHQPAKHGKM